MYTPEGSLFFIYISSYLYTHIRIRKRQTTQLLLQSIILTSNSLSPIIKMGYYDDQQQSSSNELKTKETLCSTIALGGMILLQDRPCQVIRISGPNSTTGQYRYLGVDLSTKQLHEESSKPSATNESDQVIQALDLEAWRILDLADGYATVMDTTGDVKQGLPIIDAGNLYVRLQREFESGKGDLFGLILPDGGRKLIVEMKVETPEKS